MCGIRFWHRILYIVLPLLTIGVINILSKTKKLYISIIFLAIILIEQITIVNYCAWSVKKEKEKLNFYDTYISSSCNVISIRGQYSYDTIIYRWIDSMWYAHYNGIYSQSGYSGIVIYPEDLDNTLDSKCINTFPIVPGDPSHFPYE